MYAHKSMTFMFNFSSSILKSKQTLYWISNKFLLLAHVLTKFDWVVTYIINLNYSLTTYVNNLYYNLII